MDGFTYQVERWTGAIDEALPLIEREWRELGSNHEQVPLAPDFDLYRALDAGGRLHTVTVRRNGALVGYHCSMLCAHPHHKTTRWAITDTYFLEPCARKGWVGVRLIREVERTLRAAGVQVAVMGVSSARDSGRVLERMGWRVVERRFCKYLGGKPKWEPD